MKCKYCGTKLGKGIEVCPKCGRIYKNPVGSKGAKITIIVIVAVLVVAALIGGLFILLSNADEKIKVDEVSLESEYLVLDKGINIGTLEVQYYDTEENVNYVGEVEDYDLFIDGEPAEVDNGYVTTELSEGKHTFKVEWKYEGQQFEEKQTVNILPFDPWTYFYAYGDIFVHHSLEEVEAVLGELDVCEIYDSTKIANSAWYGDCAYYIDPDTNMRFTFYNNVCESFAGTAEQIFGVTDGIKVKGFSTSKYSDGLDFVYNDDYFYNYWFGNFEMDGFDGEVFIYGGNIRPIVVKYEYDPRNSAEGYPEITEENIETYFDYVDEDFNVIKPTDFVEISKEMIDNEYEACECVENYIDENGIKVDGVFCDSYLGGYYYIEGYNDMGTHITRIFYWSVDRNGYIYDEAGERMN